MTNQRSNPAAFWALPGRHLAPAPNVCPDPVEWARTALHFDPDPVQEQILRADAQRLILCCTRQFGKSTITAIKALHFALRHPNALILVAGKCERQSAEWLLKLRTHLTRLGLRASADGINRHALVLPNGTRLVALPGDDDNVRSFSGVALLILDEAAFIPDDLYFALLPMLAVSRGALWMLSTPDRQYGFFYETWHRESSAFVKFLVPATDCPRIPADFLENARIELGDIQFRRQYLCEFAASAEQIFTRELWDKCFDPDPRFAAWYGGKTIWKDSAL